MINYFKARNTSVLFLFVAILLSGCSGVVTVEHLNVSGFTKLYTLDKFKTTYSDLLRNNGYIVKVTPLSELHTEKYTIKINGELYPFLLEAKKDSVSINTTIRLCKDNQNGLFIQFVQSTFFTKNHDKMFEEEYSRMEHLFKEKFPELKLEKKIW